MDRVARIRILDSVARDRLADGWQRAASQPNWIVRALMLVILLVVVLPLLLLAGFVAMGAILVIGGVALGRAAVEKVRRRVRGDGRSNVRVIRRSGVDE
ncbi:MAG: hypothetical protein ACYTA3_07050 [Planctomycetota bacterium]|jgi:hypothetical protein